MHAMRIWSVVLQILTLFMLIGCGVFLRKKKIFTDPVIKGVNTTILTLVWPSMVLMTTQKQLSSDLIGGFFRVLIFSALLMAVLSILLLVLCKRWLNENRLPVFIGLCALPNAGFVGLPLVSAFYGDLGLAYLSAYIVGFNLILWTLYPIIFQDKSTNPLKSALNVSMLFCFVAIMLFAFQIRIPEPFSSLLNQLGALTTPLSMLLLGSRLLESINVKKLFDKALLSAVGIRLLLFPLAIYGLMRLIGLNGMELGVMVLASAMPCANAVQMFAEKHDKDYGLAAQGISISLLLCLITIPCILLVTGL